MARAGYERVSLNRIIRSCGMSKSSFYCYLGSKEALFDAVVTEGGVALVAALEVPDPASFADGDSGAGSGGSWSRVVALGQREPWFTDLGRLFYLDDAPSGPGTALGRALAAVDAWLERALAGRAGQLRRPRRPAHLPAAAADLRRPAGDGRLVPAAPGGPRPGPAPPAGRGPVRRHPQAARRLTSGTGSGRP